MVIKQAVMAGVIFSKSSMDGLMTAEKIPSQFVISVYDTTSEIMLWNRASSNLDASTWNETTPSVSLVARDDRDLGDEPDDATGSRQPDASPHDSRKRRRDQPD